MNSRDDSESEIVRGSSISFDHDEIQRTMNRDYSKALFDRLIDLNTGPEERERVTTSLRYVDDPRLAEPLRAVVFDSEIVDGFGWRPMTCWRAYRRTSQTKSNVWFGKPAIPV
jgi:hypothetical protein